MSIVEVESAWRETGIKCPFCEGEWMTYTDGQSRPQCSNPECLSLLPDSFIWEWLITLPEFRPTLRARDGAGVCAKCGSLSPLFKCRVCGHDNRPARNA